MPGTTRKSALAKSAEGVSSGVTPSPVSDGVDPVPTEVARTVPVEGELGWVAADNPQVVEAAVAEGATPAVAEATAGAGGASNGHDHVAGGMHAASVAADVAYAQKVAAVLEGQVPDGFVQLDTGMLLATKTVEIQFTPRGMTTPSRIQLAAAGTQVDRAALLARLRNYADNEGLEIKTR